jgi:hypothetical protein
MQNRLSRVQRAGHGATCRGDGVVGNSDDDHRRCGSGLGVGDERQPREEPIYPCPRPRATRGRHHPVPGLGQQHTERCPNPARSHDGDVEGLARVSS